MAEPREKKLLLSAVTAYVAAGGHYFADDDEDEERRAWNFGRTVHMPEGYCCDVTCPPTRHDSIHRTRSGAPFRCAGSTPSNASPMLGPPEPASVARTVAPGRPPRVPRRHARWRALPLLHRASAIAAAAACLPGGASRPLSVWCSASASPVRVGGWAGPRRRLTRGRKAAQLGRWGHDASIQSALEENREGEADPAVLHE